jgi:hypothetical protein
MDSILTFVALRRPPEQPPAAATLAGASVLQRELGEADGADERAGAARTFVAQGHPVVAPDAVRSGAELVALADLLSDGEARTADEVVRAVRQAVGDATPGTWADDLQRARDTVVAAYVLGPDELDGTVAAKIVRALSVADAVLAHSASAADVDDLVRAPLLLPDALVGRRPAGEPVPEPAPPDIVAQRLMQAFAALRDERAGVTEAMEQIAAHDEDELVLKELDQEQLLAELYRPAPARDQPGRPEGPKTRDDAVVSSSPLRRAAARSNVILSGTAVRLLTEPAARTLRRYELDPVATPVRDIQARLATEQQRVAQGLTTMSLDLSQVQLAAGISQDVSRAIGDLLGRHRLDPVDDPAAVEPVASAPPTTHTDVRPMGVADLCVVRTHIRRYERGEVARLENVLGGERLTHTTRQVDETESTDTTDDEQTTVQSLAQSAAEQNTDKTTAQAVGTGRGPLTSDGPQTFSKSVTDTVSSNSTNRTRKTSVLRQLQRTEESFEHVFDNAPHAGPQFGVYQWLDKIYQAQVFTYGSRLLYDIIVPEPAALYREALARPRGQGPLPPKPAAFTLPADQLSSDNWSYYATGHRASGVEAPPQAEVCVTENFGQKAPDPFSGELNANNLEIGESRKTAIPKGYKAASYRVVALASGWTAYQLRVLIGSKVIGIDDWSPKVFSGKLDGEVETIPVGLMADGDGQNPGLSTLTLGVEILCVPTDDTVAAWQTKTHGLILAANQQRFTDYEERVAERDAIARLQLQVLTTDQKQAIVRDELKRTALAVLTNQNFSGFNATRVDALGLPYPDAAATLALSAYIRFFEQAVEWDHLACAFMPYFWGSRSSWVSKLLSLERDSQFAAFLGSGAARVVLPIRPGYEVAFETFLNTGKTPTTEKLLDVGGPLWVSLMTQLAEQGAPDDQEVSIGDSWEFRLATDLVRARRDDLLPEWTLTGADWVEQPDTSF